MRRLIVCILLIAPFKLGSTESLDASCPAFVGTSPDGTSFFADQEIPRNWTESSAHCHECNLLPATITSLQQNDFLLKNLFVNNSSERYWTSARENRENFDSLVWDDSNHLVDGFAFHAFADATGGPISTPYLNCGMYELKMQDSGWMVLKPCAFRLGTLCMITTTESEV